MISFNILSHLRPYKHPVNRWIYIGERFEGHLLLGPVINGVYH